MERRFVDADALVGLEVDLHGFQTEAQNIGVDGLALQHDFGNAAILVSLHLLNCGRKRGVLLAGHADLNCTDIFKAGGGIEVADGVEFPAEARCDLPGAAGVSSREALLQHGLQCGGVSVIQRLPVGPDRWRGRRTAEIAVRCRRDRLQGVKLAFQAVILLLQGRDGLGKACCLPSADLQPVLGEQKVILCLGDTAVLGCVQLIQQVVQGLPCLVCQHRELTAS